MLEVMFKTCQQTRKVRKKNILHMICGFLQCKDLITCGILILQEFFTF